MFSYLHVVRSVNIGFVVVGAQIPIQNMDATMTLVGALEDVSDDARGKTYRIDREVPAQHRKEMRITN